LADAHHQAEEASRLKSEFLANTSHELRTPLNGMIGFLKLVLDGMTEDPEEQRDFIEEAYRSAMHLLELINDVLDIAKIEAGKMQIDLSPVKLDELLIHVENMTRTQVQQKQLRFEIERQPTHDEIIVLGNYQRLLQVMLNLVGNAIKFTHEGEITVSTEVLKKKVAVQNQELPGLVKVRVADTGIGVSLDQQDKLFQSFSQVDGSLTRQYGGTGLGLAISQKLVEAMGGSVNFYSMGEGLGSTVTFTIPLYQKPVMIAN
jgi:signal transduction histidine kinase